MKPPGSESGAGTSSGAQVRPSVLSDFEGDPVDQAGAVPRHPAEDEFGELDAGLRAALDGLVRVGIEHARPADAVVLAGEQRHVLVTYARPRRPSEASRTPARSSSQCHGLERLRHSGRPAPAAGLPGLAAILTAPHNGWRVAQIAEHTGIDYPGVLLIDEVAEAVVAADPEPA